ncbi:MAG: glycoside hydrolase family 172 protein, partial [bacterium]
MNNIILFFAILILGAVVANELSAQQTFNGLNMNLGNLSRLSKAKTRSISPENFTGEKGKGGMAIDGTGAKAARDLGQGWKISPSIRIKTKETFTLAEIKEAGAIQHIWMTPTGNWRFLILRMYWDGETEPSVEAPVGDFFACGWGTYAQLSSLAICVNPGSAFNCYWEMPFRKSTKITMENIADEDITLYYQIDYTLTEIPEDAAYFHAQFRRVNPLPYKDVYTLLDGVKGWGQYVGTYMAWGVNSTGWWGEGEIKFYIDGDKDFPTICGTGTEDYFCGSYNFENRVTKQYQEFTTPYAGLPQVIRPDGLYNSQQRFGLYRWHIMDPIRFEKDLRV